MFKEYSLSLSRFNVTKRPYRRCINTGRQAARANKNKTRPSIFVASHYEGCFTSLTGFQSLDATRIYVTNFDISFAEHNTFGPISLLEGWNYKVENTLQNNKKNECSNTNYNIFPYVSAMFKTGHHRSILSWEIYFRSLRHWCSRIKISLARFSTLSSASSRTSHKTEPAPNPVIAQNLSLDSISYQLPHKCLILSRLIRYRQIFVKIQNLKFHKSSSSGSRGVLWAWTKRRTDKIKSLSEIVFPRTPKTSLNSLWG